MPAEFTDNQWLGWCDDVPKLQVLKQLTPQQAAFGENVYQPAPRRPTSITGISLLEQTLRHLGNGVTNMHRTDDRASKHKLFNA
jgi:hypothetical protein